MMIQNLPATPGDMNRHTSRLPDDSPDFASELDKKMLPGLPVEKPRRGVPTNVSDTEEKKSAGKPDTLVNPNPLIGNMLPLLPDADPEVSKQLQPLDITAVSGAKAQTASLTAVGMDAPIAPETALTDEMADDTTGAPIATAPPSVEKTADDEKGAQIVAQTAPSEGDDESLVTVNTPLPGREGATTPPNPLPESGMTTEAKQARPPNPLPESGMTTEAKQARPSSFHPQPQTHDGKMNRTEAPSGRAVIAPPEGGNSDREAQSMTSEHEMNGPASVSSGSEAPVYPATNFHSSLVSATTNNSPVTPEPATTPAMPSGVLVADVGTPAWQQTLGQQLACFTRDGIHHAELRLHPEDLGSLQISLRMNNEQVQLHFATGNHKVQAALESALPHLRTSLAESGIQLGQSSIGADTPSWHSSHSGHAFEQAEGDAGHEENLAEERKPELRIMSATHGRVNTFV